MKKATLGKINVESGEWKSGKDCRINYLLTASSCKSEEIVQIKKT
jgi:hypothetical protein